MSILYIIEKLYAHVVYLKEMFIYFEALNIEQLNLNLVIQLA